MAHDLHDYLFDLSGYLVLKGAVDAQHVAELNEALDSAPRDLARREWWGNCQLSSDSAEVVSFETIVEAGEPFERLIDHPSWIERVRRYCGEQDSYDFEGLCLDTATAMLRRTGGFVAMHSGAGEHALRTLYHFFDQRWYCGQVNILLALTDIGPGDGATVVIPASHKENFAHPEVDEAGDEELASGRIRITGAIEVHLDKGDALLFVDGLSHGGNARTNPGERRVVIYRYSPKWAAVSDGYHYSDALLERVTPAQRKILQPMIQRRPPVPSPEARDSAVGHVGGRRVPDG